MEAKMDTLYTLVAKIAQSLSVLWSHHNPYPISKIFCWLFSSFLISAERGKYCGSLPQSSHSELHIRHGQFSIFIHKVQATIFAGSKIPGLCQGRNSKRACSYVILSVIMFCEATLLLEQHIKQHTRRINSRRHRTASIVSF